jgi:hypothetical protein
LKQQSENTSVIHLTDAEYLRLNAVDIKNIAPFDPLGGTDDNDPVNSFPSSGPEFSEESEKVFNLRVTPFLIRLCDFNKNEQKLNNSEDFCWLTNDDLNAKKPDFNLVHEAFVQVRQFSDVLNFGGPHVAFLSQVLAIFEGKIVDLGSTEVAQLLSYLGRLHDKNCLCPGLLFNKDEWILAEKSETGFTLQRGRWEQLASFAFIKSKLSLRCSNPPILTKVVQAAIVAHNVRFTANSFLGSGSDGYVFQVTDHLGRNLAMKIGKFSVIGPESENLGRVNSLCPLSSVKLEKEVQQHQFEGEEVWGSVIVEMLEPSGRIHYGEIFKPLLDLHQRKVVHGDPRKQNFLKVPGNFLQEKYKWVDFSRSKFDATPADIALDLYICLKGLFFEHPGVVDKYQAEIKTYGEKLGRNDARRNDASTLYSKILSENGIKLKY